MSRIICLHSFANNHIHEKLIEYLICANNFLDDSEFPRQIIEFTLLYRQIAGFSVVSAEKQRKGFYKCFFAHLSSKIAIQ
jgi:hypothetical protein